MNGEIICVGTELLLGDILNTNAQYLSRELASLGINVYCQSVVGDNAVRLRKVLSQSITRSELIVITGGLGPTKDDITKETVSSAVGIPLVEHAESLKKIKDYFARIDKPMANSNLKQALAPDGAIVFPNDAGTAPGYALTSSNQVIIMLPGPPDELKTMFERYVRPYLEKRTNSTIVSRNIKLLGIGESKAAELISDLLDSSNPTVAPYAKTGEVTIRVTASAYSVKTAQSMCDEVVDKLKVIFGDKIYGIDKDSIQQVVVEQLKDKGLKLATAESCTAGLLSSRITEIPGSSVVFDMGITAYSYDVKMNALGVSPEILRKFGAVSPEVAAEMASGIKAISGSDIGVSITGVAGPDTSENKPVGLIYIGLTDGTQVWVQKHMTGYSNGDRDRIRNIAASCALDLIRRYLSALPAVLSRGTPVGLPLNVIDTEDLAIHSGTPEQSSHFHVQNDVSDTDDIFKTIQQNLDKEEETDNSNIYNQHNDILTDSMYVPEMDSEEKKKPWYARLLHYLIPWKGDPISEIIRKSIFLVALICLLGGGGYIANYYAEIYKSNQALENVQDMYDSKNNNPNESGILKKFEPLIEQNSDIRGWIKIDNTVINHPIYQAADNEFYLDRDMNKERNKLGSVFLDYKALVAGDKVSQNLVIYGHYWKDGSMFQNLAKYSPPKNSKALDFYKQNPTIAFDSLYKTGTYKIFSVFITNTKAEDDKGYVFPYRPYDFETQDAFLGWIDEVKKRSMIITPVDVIENDEIITLSTCTYEFEDARLVIMARRVRDGESVAVNVSESKLNPSPLYPQRWYEKKKGTKPDNSSRPAQSQTPSRNNGNSSGTSTENPDESDTNSSNNTTSEQTSTPDNNTSSRGGGSSSTNPSTPTPSGGNSSDGTPSDGTPSDDTPSDGTPSDGTPSDGTPSDGTPSDDTPSDGTPSDGTPSDDTPSDDTPSDDTPSETTSTDTGEQTEE